MSFNLIKQTDVVLRAVVLIREGDAYFQINEPVSVLHMKILPPSRQTARRSGPLRYLEVQPNKGIANMANVVVALIDGTINPASKIAVIFASETEEKVELTIPCIVLLLT